MENAPELVQLMGRLFRFWAAGDYQSLMEVISRHSGALMIGTDPDEWWADTRDFAAVLRVQWQETPPFAMDVGEIVAWKEGTVGWAAGKAEFRFEEMTPVPVRATAVFREEGAYWRVVQWHNSVGVANEDVVGMELTTTVDEILTAVQDEEPSVPATANDGSVTIVFTDIEGSTALMETLGEEPWLKLLEWHESAVRSQTNLFGGSVVKGQGDGFMLAFPGAGSAVACASALQRALADGWAGVQAPVRIGMHTGNAKAEAGDFFGRTVVVAARVASAAEGGEILITQAVQEELAGAFRLGTSRTLALKGLAGHHLAFPVIWETGRGHSGS